MDKHKQVFSTTLALSSLLVAALTALPAQAEMSPGYVYDAQGKVARDSQGKCLHTSAWSKENANKECNPELFPEPKAAAPAPAPMAAPAPAPAPAPVVVVPPPPVHKVMTFEAAALFGVNKSDISPAGKEKIKEYREQVRAEMDSARTIKITGHTDSSGKAEYNQKLSVKRAEAVRDYLISLGADASKMEVEGMGATKPIADNKTKAGRAKNRRVEVEVTGTAK
jgi:OOP family OmpA-OmpF porin